jgi:hypothetical protein
LPIELLEILVSLELTDHAVVARLRELLASRQA